MLQRQANLTMYEPQPDEQPANVYCHKNTEHPLQAEGIHRTGGRQLQQAQADGIPHVHGRMPAADDQIGEKAGDGNEGSPHAKQLQDGRTRQPFLGNGNDNQFLGYQAQTKHGGKGNESGEAEQLAEDVELALAVVGNAGKDRLGNAIDHVGNERMAHTVPFVGLRKVAHFLGRIELTQHNRKEIVVENGEEVGHKQLAGSAKFLANKIGAELGIKTRAIELSTLQRCAAHMTSRTDITEAYNVGGAAVKAAFEGETGKVVVLKRVSDDPYMCITETNDVHQIANIEKKVPLEWITDDDFVTDDLIHYIRPLIQAELSPIMVDGLPRHLNINAK